MKLKNKKYLIKYKKLDKPRIMKTKTLIEALAYIRDLGAFSQAEVWLGGERIDLPQTLRVIRLLVDDGTLD